MSSLTAETLPVLIVGAGPTGLIAAIELARRGIKFRIIDKASEPSKTSKALFVQARTLEILDHIGIADQFLNNALFVKGQIIHTPEENFSINFAQLESPFPFGVTVPQAMTEKILIEHLKPFSIEVERAVQLETIVEHATKVTAKLIKESGPEIADFSYIIGADGAHSTVRHATLIEFAGDSCIQPFALVDCNVEGELISGDGKDRLHLFISEKGILAIFPLPGGTYRIIVNDIDSSKGTPTLDEIQKLVYSRNCKLILKDPTWLSYFHISSRQAVHYRKGRIFLAGDAAHVHSPAGGLGMNTGIQDAYNLAWKLALVIQGKSPTSLLVSYEVERLPVAKTVVSVTEYFTKFMISKNKWLNILRNNILPHILASEFIEKQILSRIAQLDLNYRSSPIVKDAAIFPSNFVGPQAGDRIPDIELKEGSRLYDVIKSTKYTLLLIPGVRSDDETKEGFKETILKIESNYSEIIDYRVLDEKEYFDSTLSTYLLIRPDHYIAFRSKPASNHALFKYLNHLEEN